MDQSPAPHADEAPLLPFDGADCGPFLTEDEASELLRLKPYRFRQLVAKLEMPQPYLIGNQPRYDRNEIVACARAKVNAPHVLAMPGLATEIVRAINRARRKYATEGGR